MTSPVLHDVMVGWSPQNSNTHYSDVTEICTSQFRIFDWRKSPLLSAAKSTKCNLRRLSPLTILHDVIRVYALACRHVTVRCEHFECAPYIHPLAVYAVVRSCGKRRSLAILHIRKGQNTVGLRVCFMCTRQCSTTPS